MIRDDIMSITNRTVEFYKIQLILNLIGVLLRGSFIHSSALARNNSFLILSKSVLFY